MIKLKDILKEFEYGDKLWADPMGGMDITTKLTRYQDFIKKIYNNDIEYNTPEEAKVLKAIVSYLKYNNKEGINPYLDELLKLKKKFPNILDPKSSNRTKDKLYRGMTGVVDVIVKYIESAKEVKEVTIKGSNWILLKDVSAIVTSRAAGGFVSMTTSINKSVEFGFASSEDRWPIITETPYISLESSVIWNPEYLATLSKYDESEIWFLGNSFPATNIYIYNPPNRSYNKILSNALSDRFK